MRDLFEQEFVRPDGNLPLANLDYDRTRFRLVTAKSIHFRKVSFKYSLFDDCYLRDCRFEDCDFTGATFRNCVTGRVKPAS